MTIDSDWVEVMKGECPSAFTASPPFPFKGAYLDGMPLLMASGTTRRWDDLVKRNFAGPISRYFRMGAKTVVLAFDDYKYVPKAKAITQANRSKGKAVFQFHDRQNLETVMPPDYNERLCNRVYKRRVIDLVAETVAEHVRLQEGQRLVVDYVDCPVLFEVDATSKKVGHSYMTGVPPMGECDVKFTRWARVLGDMAAHSVDGDFIPIALMEYETQLNSPVPPQRSGASSRSAAPPAIAIFRIEYNMNSKKSAATVVTKQKTGQAKKRDSAGRPVSLRAANGKIEIVDAHRGGGASSSSGAQAEAQPAQQQKPRRSMEYVNIPLLYHSMSEALRQCGAHQGPEVCRNHMRLLACLIALTGTDFTRKLPQISPKRVWDLLPVKGVWSGLLESYDADAGQMVPRETCDRFIAHLYSQKFSNHVPAGVDTLSGVLHAIGGSKLSEKTKDQLPSVARADTTVRNANWVLRYWECRQPVPSPLPSLEAQEEGEICEQEVECVEPWDHSQCYPDPLCPEFGFKVSKARKDAVQWLDQD